MRLPITAPEVQFSTANTANLIHIANKSINRRYHERMALSLCSVETRLLNSCEICNDSVKGQESSLRPRMVLCLPFFVYLMTAPSPLLNAFVSSTARLHRLLPHTRYTLPVMTHFSWVISTTHGVCVGQGWRSSYFPLYCSLTEIMPSHTRDSVCKDTISRRRVCLKFLVSATF